MVNRGVDLQMLDALGNFFGAIATALLGKNKKN